MAILSNNETRGDFTHTKIITYEDLIAAGTGGTIEIGLLPAHAAVELCYVAELTAFVGNSTTDIQIGSYTTAATPVVVDVDGYMATVAVDAMTVPVFNTGAGFTTAETVANKLLLCGGGAASALSESDTRIMLTYTDANAADLTAGELFVGVRILDPGRFLNP